MRGITAALVLAQLLLLHHSAAAENAEPGFANLFNSKNLSGWVDVNT